MNNKEKIVEMSKILVDDMGEDVAKERIFDQKTDFEMMRELTNCKKGYKAERIFNDYGKTIIRSLWNKPYKIISRIWFKKQNLRFKDFAVRTQNKEGMLIADEVDIKYQCREDKLILNTGYFDEVINIVENQTMNVNNLEEEIQGKISNQILMRLNEILPHIHQKSILLCLRLYLI